MSELVTSVLVINSLGLDVLKPKGVGWGLVIGQVSDQSFLDMNKSYSRNSNERIQGTFQGQENHIEKTRYLYFYLPARSEVFLGGRGGGGSHSQMYRTT